MYGIAFTSLDQGEDLEVLYFVHGFHIFSQATIFLLFFCRCPYITRLYTLSEPSVNGVPLYVLEITDHPGKHELGTVLTHRIQILYISIYSSLFPHSLRAMRVFVTNPIVFP